MSILTQVRDAVRRAEALIPTTRQEEGFRPFVKRLPQRLFLWPDLTDQNIYQQWYSADYETFAREGFGLNSLIYSAIMYKVRAQSMAPLRAYTGDIQNPEPLPEDHPLSRLVKRPNPQMSWAEFQGYCTVSLNLDGNAFIAVRRDENTNTPTELLPLRPDRVRILPSKRRELLGFAYIPEGQTAQDNAVPILPEDMIHVKLPNPMDRFEGWGRGMSPLSCIAYSADVDNAVTKFVKIFFERGAMVRSILKVDSSLDRDTIEAIKERWREQYGGYENWADVGVLDQGVEHERLGLTFEEMGFLSVDERNEARVLGPFGVPGILVGSRLGLMRSTYSNYETARRSFWEDTFKPELGLFEDEYSYFLRMDRDPSAFVAFDFSEVPALQQNVPALVAAWAAMIQAGEDRDVAAQTVGLNLPPKPEKDEIIVPAEPEEPDNTMEGAAEAQDDAEQGREEEPIEQMRYVPYMGQKGQRYTLVRTTLAEGEADVYVPDNEGLWVMSPFGRAAQKGGPGSGNHGHRGVPGQRGGSLPRGAWSPSMTSEQADEWAQDSAAFPGWIPTAIQSGDVEHTEPFPGDNGIRFEPRDQEPSAED